MVEQAKNGERRKIKSVARFTNTAKSKKLMRERGLGETCFRKNESELSWEAARQAIKGGYR
jgi:hypothetical protein